MTREFIRILHLEDSPYDAELIQSILERGGIKCQIERVQARDEFVAMLDRGGFDLILSDYSLPGFDGLSALKLSRERCPDVPFVFVSAAIGEERAIDSLKHGATDYVLKQRLSRLVHAVSRTLQEVQERSERRHAEKALKENQERFRSIVETSQEWIWETDEESHVTFSNSAVMKILGYSPADLIGCDRASFLHEDDKRMVDALLPGFIAGKRGWTALTLRWRHKSGSYRWLESNAAPVLDEDGVLTGFRGVDRDITERIEAEGQLRASEERFRLIAENVADMIAVLDLEGKRLYNSPSYSEILGEPSMLGGTDSFREIHPDDRERIKDIFAETITTGFSRPAEYRLRAKDGTYRFIESQGSVIRDDRGEPSRVLVVSRDISERKQAEHERMILQEQLRQSQKMESIGTLAGGLAHDFNNLLGVIIGHASILGQGHTDPGRLSRAIESINTAAQRGTNLVRQLLTFARKTDEAFEPVHVNALVEEVLRMIRATFPRTISYSSHLATNIPLIMAEPGQMHQALLNLFVNARDAMPEGGVLSVATSIADGIELKKTFPDAVADHYVVIAVKDTGVGIDEETRKRVFEPFFTTKEKGKGTGLGLSVLYGIMKGHHGFVDLESETGKGTTFHLYFPVRNG